MSSEDDIGPELPPGFQKPKPTSKDRSPKRVKSSDDDCYGPALPPGFEPVKEEKKTGRCDVIGPSIPAHLLASICSNDNALGEENASEDEDIGPSLDMAAPADAVYDAAQEFADRMRSIEAEKKREEEERLAAATGRDEWMTALPTVGLAKDIGLQARSFKTKYAAGQDDSWTKTPNQAASSNSVPGNDPNLKRHYEDTSQKIKDEQIEKKLTKYNDDNRKASLVDMHQKRLKKEKKTSTDEKKERRPFSREDDLNVNKFDEAQKKQIIKKAAQLDSRFSHGVKKYE